MIDSEQEWREINSLRNNIIQLISCAEYIPSSLGEQLQGIQSHYEAEIACSSGHAKRKSVEKYRRALSSLFWKLHKEVFGTDMKEQREGFV